MQARIDATELKVEELTGQLKALREQVTYGTLTVSISERAAHHATTHRHGFLGALSTSWRHLVGGFEAIVVGLGAVIPFAVLLAALLASPGTAPGPPAACASARASSSSAARAAVGGRAGRGPAPNAPRRPRTCPETGRADRGRVRRRWE